MTVIDKDKMGDAIYEFLDNLRPSVLCPKCGAGAAYMSYNGVAYECPFCGNLSPHLEDSVTATREDIDLALQSYLNESKKGE